MTTTPPTIDLLDRAPLAYGLALRWVRRCLGPDNRPAALQSLPAEFAALVRHTHEQVEWLRLLFGSEAVEQRLIEIERRAGEFLDATVLLPENRLSDLERFIQQHVEYNKSSRILFKDFYETFAAWLPADKRRHWSKVKVGRAIPSPFEKRTGNQNVMYLFRAAWRGVGSDCSQS